MIFFPLILAIRALQLAVSSPCRADSVPVVRPDLPALIRNAEALNLASDPQWLKLGHYRRRFFGGYASGSYASGGYTSEAIGEGFFLSPEGRKDPQKELIATIQALFSRQEHAYLSPHDQPDHQFARCQFPARTLWLERRLGFDAGRDLPAADCTRFEKFKQALQAKSVSLVFSSYYLNNPSSVFGHSFLRINKSVLKGRADSRNEERAELLDHGVNFAADVTTDNAFLYAVYGLFGLFRGTYANVPYYYKVREYNDYESRDLWSYDLNLTDEELRMLVAHLWELGSTYFDYYYFSQNCSYQILTALEAAAPRYEIVDSLRFYVIPSDTIKRITDIPGLVTHIDYRPSVRSTFQTRFNTLSEQERRALYGLVVRRDHAEPARDLPLESRVRVLDTALDYMDYRFPAELLKPASPSALWKQSLLLARAETGEKTSAPVYRPPPGEMPQAGHGSARFGVAGGYESGVNSFTQLDMRFALHDLLDPGSGYPHDAQIEFGHIQGRYYFDPRQIQLESLDLIRIFSLNPVNEFDRDKSWRIQVGLDRVHDGNCQNCLAGTVQMGGGYAVEPFGSPALTAFAMGEAETSYASAFLGSSLRLGLGPAAGIVAGNGSVKGLLTARYRYEIFAVDPTALEATSEVRWSFSHSLALDVSGSIYSHAAWQGAGGLFYYF